MRCHNICELIRKVILYLTFFNFIFPFLSTDTTSGMDRKVLVAFGILILFTITVLLTDGQKTRRKSPWSRRFIRQRPTKAMTGGSRPQINPAESAQNSQDQQQDFDSAEDAEEYWRIIYENGKWSQTLSC